jgi:hypothetical protein
MDWLTLLVIVGVVLVLVALKLTLQGKQTDEYPYTRNQVLFSPAERAFLGVLEQGVGEEYRVFGKVRVADVVSVKSMSNRSVWQRAFNRINAKHFDFVLCRNNDLAVVAVIELDDKSHQSKKRQGRDAFIVGLCKAIELPLIQVPAQAAYTVSDIRARILAAVKFAGGDPELSAASKRESIIEPKSVPLHENSESIEMVPSASEAERPLCPNCSSPMVPRKAKAGANAGQEFWGCSAFPRTNKVRSCERSEPQSNE